MKRSFFAILFGLTMLFGIGGVANAAPATRPNIVFVVSDDQGWRDIGYHDSDVLTPHLDKLATDGIKLHRHYVYPTCSPTRAALISGRNPSRFGINVPIAGTSKLALPTDIATLPEALRRLGYHTAISGKWHLGLRPQVGPRRYGFISSYGYLHGQIDPYTHLYKTGDRTWHRNEQFIEEEGHATDLITDEAVRVIESAGDKPFFLYVPYSVPHTPLSEPDRWTSMYIDRIKEPSRRWFAASITHMDEGIGRIVAALERTGKRDNTLIVFISDNGGQKSWHRIAYYKGRYADKPHNVLANNLPLRGWKGQLYEGGVRVPALVNWPSKLKPGKLDAPVWILDWFPTLVSVAGGLVESKDRLEGENIWPLLTGQRQPQPRTFYWNTGGLFAVRHGDWKIIQNRKQPKKAELYNLADDPYETRNLAGMYPNQLAHLRGILGKQRQLDP